jgi:hypothetical protein
LGRPARLSLQAVKGATAAEIAAMRQQVETEVAARNAVIEELRAMLAEARRPWWRRWLGGDG